MDAHTGIQFRGIDLYDAVNKLRTSSGELLPEAIFYLLLVNKIPNANELNEFKKDLVSRMQLTDETVSVVKNLPKNLHPMAKLSIGMLTMQKDSKFTKAYNEGVNKNNLWEYMLEDALDLAAKTFTLGAVIHNSH